MDDSARNSPQERPDPWRASLDSLDALRARLAEVEQPQADTRTRELMAGVMLDRASSFLVLMKATGAVLDVSRAALSVGGLDREEVIGQPLWQTPWWRGSTTAQTDTRLAIWSLAGGGRPAHFDVDLWIESAGSARGTLDLTIRPLRGRDGQVVLLLADGRSVSDRRGAERRIVRQQAELTVLTDRLTLMGEQQERLVGDLSHDLWTPLQALVEKADKLLDPGHPAEVRAEAGELRTAATTMLAQLEVMVEAARRGDADHGLSPSTSDLAGMVRSVLDEFAPIARERKVEVVERLPVSLPATYDGERISRVLANLLANALRFTPVGGLIRCSLTVHGSLVHLEVADSGPGVPAAARDTLFERFATTRVDASGASLGLAIVKEFVELHGGAVTVDTAPEGGALFIATLPLDRPGAAVPSTPAQLYAAARQIAFVREALTADLDAAHGA